jgi:glycosyltransferase involved in cell wall biosynthesis
MRPVDRWLGRFANGLATAIVANCEACRQAVIADERASPERVFVLENGVDLERFLDIEPPSAEASAHRCVGAVANLRPVKGLDHLVSAARLVCAKHPDVTFEVAGEGEARGLLERQIQDAGLEGRFLLRGSLSDVPRFLQSLEIAVLSSLAEGMPNAVLEYMAAARPIVVTSVGATSQLISDGVEGLLVPPGDARALAGAIEQLLQSPERARNLGLAARRRAQQQYSREAMVRRFEGFYEDLVRGPAAAKES